MWTYIDPWEILEIMMALAALGVLAGGVALIVLLCQINPDLREVSESNRERLVGSPPALR